jgi:4-amino-4-deoxy-L-arabinose transferase-like glycosyltransferase
MDEPQRRPATPPPVPARGSRLLAWIKANRVPLLFALVLALMVPCRDLWAPDEPDFAQCVREMRERGSWLLPYLNGLPYSEKPILFYWLMKLSAMGGEWLTGGAGFTHGVAAWALRLPSALAAAGFLFGFRSWTARFVDPDLAEPACLVLGVVPIWVLQAQTIQIDMVFAALLAWSWCSWLAGYLLLRGLAPRPGGTGAGQARAGAPGTAWFVMAYAALALAFLAKGPLAVVLSLPLALAFLAWQRDLRALGSVRAGTGLLVGAAIVLPWYLAATVQGGAAYAYQMVVHQNLERALHAWDHIQPPWKYVEYLASDFFPWTLLLPAAALALARPRKAAGAPDPATRFQVLAVAVPFLLLSCSQSKQSKYLLMVYPFLALLLARLLVALAPDRVRRFAWLLAGGLALPGLALAAVSLLGAGGHRLQAQVGPYLGPLRLLAAIFLAGAAVLAARPAANGRFLARTVAATLGLAFLVTGTWGFRRLDPLKGYRAWTAAVTPLIAGRQVYFWQTIRSGVMVYTDHRMPELHSRAELDRTLGPDQRLVAMRREWDADAWGMDARSRQDYEILLRMPVGGGEALLLRRRPSQPPPPRAASPE